ncbi:MULTISPECIES: hypothetical protein [Rhizobium/Agrobacterium group]|uniref:hypothetical protein n=1 Tax=Rhizobium/Agrobacterium group TaxID=227290 RepID=UPI0025711AFE|nr:hypothetical protein [Agrobacterium sp. Ap1]
MLGALDADILGELAKAEAAIAEILHGKTLASGGPVFAFIDPDGDELVAFARAMTDERTTPQNILAIRRERTS